MRSGLQPERALKLLAGMSVPGETGHPGFRDISQNFRRDGGETLFLGTADRGLTLCSHPTYRHQVKSSLELEGWGQTRRPYNGRLVIHSFFICERPPSAQRG